MWDVASAAVRRKVAATAVPRVLGEETDRWAKYHAVFVKRLESANFGGIVFDYDGTLCEPDRRREGIKGEVAA